MRTRKVLVMGVTLLLFVELMDSEIEREMAGNSLPC